MKKKFHISKMLGIGFLSMTTILGGTLLSMHDVFAAGGDGKDGDTQGTSQGTTDSSSDSVSILSYLQALYLDNESDEEDISRVGVDQYLDDSSFLNFENDSLNSLPFDVGYNSTNSVEGQNPAPLPSAPSSPISPQNANLSVNTGKRATRLADNKKRQRKPKCNIPLTENALRIKNAIYWFGADHGFIEPSERVLKIGRNCAIDVPLRKEFAQKVVKTVKEWIPTMTSLRRDERRVSSLMYNNVADHHFNDFMRLMHTPAFEAYCVNVCRGDENLLNKLGATINDIH